MTNKLKMSKYSLLRYIQLNKVRFNKNCTEARVNIMPNVELLVKWEIVA